MSLPNPGMDFTPFDTLPAASLDDMVENIEALAEGSGLDNGAVTPEKLSFDAITLGYAQITSSFTNNSGTATQVTGLTSSVTIPAGGRKIRITAYAPTLSNGTVNGQSVMTIWDGTVGSGTQLQRATSSNNGNIDEAGSGQAIAQAIVTPAAGAKTYNVGLAFTNGSNARIYAAATSPAFILVEAI